MKAVIQRVVSASVTVGEEIVGQIKTGLVVLLGIAATDDDQDAIFMAEKIINLRIFNDECGKMNRSLAEIEGEMLVVSQFTLLGDCRKGRRPSYIEAARPEKAKALYERFLTQVREQDILVQTGRFQAMMTVTLENDGPVTLIIESKPKAT